MSFVVGFGSLSLGRDCILHIFAPIEKSLRYRLSSPALSINCPTPSAVGPTYSSGSNNSSNNCPTPSAVGPTYSSGSNNSSNDTVIFKPISNCSSLGTQYSSPNTQAQFAVHCQTDFAYNDLFSIFIYTFEDCINSCASFNQHYSTNGVGNCTHISYSTNMTVFPKANCYIKGASRDGTFNLIVDSAVVVTS